MARHCEDNVRMAEETLRIIGAGAYTSPTTGKVARLSPPSTTTTYLDTNPVPPLPVSAPSSTVTVFEVCRETTLEGCRRAVGKVGCLNFASAKNPGGGFMRGTMAQEESLAYSSTLFASIGSSPMYRHNRENLHHGLYSHSMIVSDGVVVFRDSTFALLEPADLFTVTVITAPAVNVRVTTEHNLVVQATMRERAHRVLWLAVVHGITTLVLGSWGCGVFGGSITFIADLFMELLTTRPEFTNRFVRVIFSTTDAAHVRVFQAAIRAAT